jgi:hypothetical protein
MSEKSAIVVPGGLVSVSAALVLLGLVAPAGTVSEIAPPAHEESIPTPAAGAARQAAFGHSLPPALQV